MQRSAAAGRLPTVPGCEVAETTAGRPIHDGEAFVLPEVIGGSPPRTPAAAHWMRAARTEYASVAAFARLATELMALGAPRPDLTLRELAIEALLEGCIGEGVAAAEAARAIEGASERVRPVLETIARDELRHATLSWGVLG